MNYVLIKDLPDLEKGAVFESSVDGVVYFHLNDKGKQFIYRKENMKPEWFEKETN